MTAVRFTIAGGPSLIVGDRAERRLLSQIETAMEPYPPHQDVDRSVGSADPAIVIEPLDHAVNLTEMQLAAGDGLVTANDDERFYAIVGGRVCSIPGTTDGPQVRFAYEPGFPVDSLMSPLIRPMLQLQLPSSGSVAMHASAVEIDGRAVLIGGWSESGKTETALALLERGARFVSDKWTTVLPTNSAAPFPIGVGIRRWVVRHLPRLRRELPPAAKRQFVVAGVASGLAGPIMRLPARRPAVRLAVGAIQRAAALADRAGLRPSEMHAIYGNGVDDLNTGVPIDLVVALQTSGRADIEASVAAPGRIASRLAQSAALERLAFYAYRQRAAYARALEVDEFPMAVGKSERELLERLLRQVTCIEVSAPFPTDPRRVVSAIERWL